MKVVVPRSDMSPPFLHFISKTDSKGIIKLCVSSPWSRGDHRNRSVVDLDRDLVPKEPDSTDVQSHPDADKRASEL